MWGTERKMEKKSRHTQFFDDVKGKKEGMGKWDLISVEILADFTEGGECERREVKRERESGI